MRRKEREMARVFGLSVIDKTRFGTLSTIDNQGKPHGLPLSIVRNGDVLYFHSSKEGEKVEILENNPYVSISFVGDVKIPENYTEEELDKIAKDASITARLISSVFTTEFESAIVTGKVEKIQNENEKIDAMRLICEKYTPEKMKYFNAAIKSGLGRVNVYKVSIETGKITAKRKKYDSNGEEMKWGRMV
jgi:nitroimidazol reductase NimA-like FMN-containing flavoprotein (pyridoxamine 5'-phosphate oxidase superfamily)